MRGYIPIEQVTTGDMVLTHTNTYKRVTKIGTKPNAKIITLRGMCFKEITCTPNHPFYVRKLFRVWNNEIREYERKFSEPQWLAAGELTKDYYIGYAINTLSQLPKWDGVIATRWKNRVNKLAHLFGNPTFWYIMGRYLGDGWKKNSHTGSGIVICCSSRNRNSLLLALRQLGWRYCISEERTVTKVIICSNELNTFVDRYGYKAHGKLVDAETINLPKHLLKGFVDGFVDSDGCFVGNEYKCASVSETLIYGMQQCISKAYECPVRIYFSNRRKQTTIEGRIVNQRDSYSLAWHPDKRKQDKAFYEDGYVWFPLRKGGNHVGYSIVYNMSVEDDESYTANGAIVHNCTSISNAGKQAGLTEDSGTASSLLWYCRNAIEIKRPKYLLMENVKALLQKKFQEQFHKWLHELEDFGYTNFYKVLNAKDFGVAQNRERVFMVSIHNCDKPYIFPNGFELTKCVEDYLEPEVTKQEYYIDQLRVTNKVLSDLLDQEYVRKALEKLYHDEWRERMQAGGD